MNTDDMAQRGADDAEHGDEPNPFYYQHYYHYRRTYNRVRQRQQPLYRRAVFWFIGLAVVAALAFFLLRDTMFVARPPTLTPRAQAAYVQPTATPRPLFPTPTALEPTAPPTPSAGLQTNVFATVSNTAGKVLRSRAQPNLKAKVVTTFKEGERVRLVEGPVDADGLRWWRIEGEHGQGWSAENSPQGDVWLVPSLQ